MPCSNVSPRPAELTGAYISNEDGIDDPKSQEKGVCGLVANCERDERLEPSPRECGGETSRSSWVCVFRDKTNCDIGSVVSKDTEWSCVGGPVIKSLIVRSCSKMHETLRW